MRQAGNQNWFLGNYSAALRNVRFFLVVILEGLEHVVHNSLVLGWFMMCCGSLFLKTVGQVLWFWDFIETNSPFFTIIQIFWFVGLDGIWEIKKEPLCFNTKALFTGIEGYMCSTFKISSFRSPSLNGQWMISPTCLPMVATATSHKIDSFPFLLFVLVVATNIYSFSLLSV